MKLLKKVVLQTFGKRERSTRTAAEIHRMIVEGRIDEASLAIPQLDPQTPNAALMRTCLEGEVAFHRRDDAGAEELFRQALNESPGLPGAHYGISLIRYAQLDIEAAVRHALFAVNGDSSPRMNAQMGVCHMACQNFTKARDFLLRAVRDEPMDKSSWNNLGIARRALGNVEGAQDAFSRALSIDPNHVQARDNARVLAEEIKRQSHDETRALVASDDPSAQLLSACVAEIRELMRRGEAGQAHALCEWEMEQAPDDGELALEMSEIQRKLDEPQIAIDVLRAFHVQFPEHARVRSRLGLRLVQAGKHSEARPLLELALAADAEDLDAVIGLAEIRFDKWQFVEAGRLYERAYALRPSLDTQGHLMSAYSAQCRYLEVLDMIAKMEKQDPAIAANLMTFRIDALTGLGRHDEILPTLNGQIALRPFHSGLRFARASILLAREDFELGWEDYTYRNIQDAQYARVFQFNPWKGESLQGKRLLVAADQGIGDQVMFLSCLPDLEAMNPMRVLVEVTDRLQKTTQRSFPSFEVVGSEQKRSLDWLVGQGTFDYWCLLGDLPRYLRKHRAQFPDHDGYLVADSQRRSYWRSMLDARAPTRRPRIGFSWRGGTERTRTSLRSMDIMDMSPLTRHLDATWVCLQYGDVAADVRRANDEGFACSYWKEGIDDLDEFAALVSELDLIVTVCNTTVHYAGALAKPVWVLAPKVPEWRYGLAFRSMPWYPSSVVYRQEQAGEWASLVAQVGQDLANWWSQRPEE
jgi:tetratricopeptide (TPR) repeat protein